MKTIIVFFMLCVSISVVSQETITKEVGEFSVLKVFDGISANLIKSKENKIVISGNEATKVTVVNANGKLKIRMEIDEIFNGHKTYVDVHYTDNIAVIDANENAFISSSETIKQVDITLRSQEAAEIDLSVNVQKLDVKSVTGGQIVVKGTAKNQEVNINTGGKYEADQLLTEQTAVDVNAGGVAYINASQYVEAKVRAGGTIHIYGKPKVIDKQTFLGGKIIEQ